jgi:hypothetical protein
MFEHVGLKNLPAYFSTVHRLLKADGLVLNHGITTSDVNNGWVGLGAGEFIDLKPSAWRLLALRVSVAEPTPDARASVRESVLRCDRRAARPLHGRLPPGWMPANRPWGAVLIIHNAE